jgi:hypothetical protein
VCLYFVFPQPHRWVVGWESSTDGGGGFFILQVLHYSLVLKISNEGASSGDPKGKSKHGSRSEKRWRELAGREKPALQYVGASGSTSDVNKPSEECKAAVFHALYK